MLLFLHASAPLRRAWSKDSSLSRFMPSLSSPLLGKSLNLTQQPQRPNVWRFKGFRQAPFHSIPSALLQRGSACGLKIDVDGVQLRSKAARFRVASQSAVLSTGMNRICEGNDHCCRTLDSFARSWDDVYLVSSAAHFTTSAFQWVARRDSLRSILLTNSKVTQRESSGTTPKLDLLWTCCFPNNVADTELRSKLIHWRTILGRQKQVC